MTRIAVEHAANAKVLQDPELDERLRRDGFVVFPVLTPDEVASVRAAYRSLRPDTDVGLAIDYMRPDREYMHRVRELTDPLWARHLPELFVDHHVAFTTFVTKHPSEDSGMFLHEDRSFVDEREVRAGTLWIPLVDVGPGRDNGGLQLVPGTHRFGTLFSGTGTPELFRPYEDDLRQHLVVVEVPAGHGVYYDTRTLHTSPPNLSADSREAIACAVVQNGAKLVHVVASGRRHRSLYQVADDFFLDHHPHAAATSMPPTAVLLEEWEEDDDLSPEEIGAVIGGRPQPRVDVPWNVPAATGSGALTRIDPPSSPPQAHDVAFAASRLPSPDQAVSRHRYQVLTGTAGLVTVDRADARRPEVTRRLAELGGLPRSADEIDLLVLDPGARLEVVVGEARALRWCLDVVEAPRVTAGIRTATDAEALDLGVSLEVADGSTCVLWNDGPGPLVASLAGVPDRGALAHLRGRVAAATTRRSFTRQRRAELASWLAER